MTWTRSLLTIDREIAAVEAKLLRVRNAAHERSAVGRCSLVASLHEQLAGLWRERVAVLNTLERSASHA